MHGTCLGVGLHTPTAMPVLYFVYRSSRFCVHRQNKAERSDKDVLTGRPSQTPAASIVYRAPKLRSKLASHNINTIVSHQSWFALLAGGMSSENAIHRNATFWKRAHRYCVATSEVCALRRSHRVVFCSLYNVWTARRSLRFVQKITPLVEEVHLDCAAVHAHVAQSDLPLSM